MKRIIYTSFILIVVILYCCEKKQSKKAIFAGYYCGNMVSPTFELYEDGTYKYTLISDEFGTWTSRKDTFFLFNDKDKFIGHIFNKVYYPNDNNVLPYLRVMNFKHFNPAKVVNFPTCS